MSTDDDDDDIQAAFWIFPCRTLDSPCHVSFAIYAPLVSTHVQMVLKVQQNNILESLCFSTKREKNYIFRFFYAHF